MWKICRKTLFPRCLINRQNTADNSCPKAVALCQDNEEKKYSSDEKKRHAHKQDKQYWDDPQFRFHFIRISLLESAGWLGTTAALCINAHLKFFLSVSEDRTPKSSCIFLRDVLAMPKNASSKEIPLLSSPFRESFVFPKINNDDKDRVSSDTSILEDIRNLTVQYTAAVKNSEGIASLDKNNRKAFRYFQAAARLGSSQAFYNLGLCYELGKGTRVNFSRAAFCYRKAAIKGHGLATFNLAIYFLKGIGGLPVDTQTAMLLLAEAAKKDVPEAQTYFGIEFLEKKKWPDAVAIFRNLAEKNVPDGQYYLGLCYENGWGVKKDVKVAHELYKKSADKGNGKAEIKLKNYSEDEKSVSKNKPFTMSFYQMLNNRSSKNYENYFSFLQQGSRTNLDIKESPKSLILEKFKKNCLHPSVSVPELAAGVKISAQLTTKISTPLYLDLMIPLLTIKNSYSESKPHFFIGESKTEDSFNNFLPYYVSNLPKIMSVET